MKVQKKMMENEFRKFFYDPSYIRLKSYLFNYRMRKEMVSQAFFKYFKKPFKEDFVVGDVGSGVSPISPLLSHTLFVELEDKAIEYLKEKRCKVIKGDITQLPLPEERFDAIVCSEVLEHVKEYNQGISEMARVLKNKGAVIITVPIHMKYWNADDEFVGHFRRFDPDVLQKDIEKAGLQVIMRKPIGSGLERWLTLKMIDTARSNDISTIWKSKVKFLGYKLANSALFYAIRFAQFFSSEENSSIILFMAVKK